MKFRKKLVLLTLISALTLCAIGKTVSFMMKHSKVKDIFKKSSVSCAVYEKFDNSEITGNNKNKNKGETIGEIKLENTGNIPAYMRFKIISYWEDYDGSIVSEPSEIPNIVLNEENWIKNSENTYYFKSVVEPGEKTANALRESFTLKNKKIEDGSYIYQVVQIIPEAMQYIVKEEISKVWNVNFKDDLIVSVNQ